MDELDPDYLLDLAEQVKNSSEDIAEAEAKEFVNAWANTIVSIPATFVNWRSVAGSVLVNLTEAGNAEALGNWKTKAVSSPEVVEAMGAFANYVDVFIDYINVERKSSIKQSVSLFSKVGYLDLVIDNKGRESYIPINTENEPETMVKCIKDIIEAFENFR